MTTPNYRFIDGDQHLYEPPDAYSRHLEQKYRNRMITLQPGDVPGSQRWCFDGQPFLPDHHTRVIGPGVWKSVFAHAGEGRFSESEDAVINPQKEHPDIVDRDARLVWMDEHNFEATVLIPTTPCDALAGLDSHGDLELQYAHMRAYNRHLEDDWGYRYKNRIFAVPQLTLDDRDLAVEELERLIRADAKFVLLPPRSTATHRSPADPYFDPFWERLVEANVLPLIHLTASSDLWEYSGHWGEATDVYPVSDAGTPLVTGFQNYVAFVDRPIMDFTAALILHNLFGRIPALRMMIVENGVGWVPYLLEQLDKSYRMSYDNDWLGGRPPELPSETFKRHLYLTPFFGDRIVETIDLLGADRVMLGSDFPHPEGVATPSDYLEQLADQPEALVRSFMRDTAAELYGLGA